MRLEQGDLAAADGQLHLDFENRDDEGDEAPATFRLHAGPRTAADWFEQGVDTPGLTLIRVRAEQLHYWDGGDEGVIRLGETAT